MDGGDLREGYVEEGRPERAGGAVDICEEGFAAGGGVSADVQEFPEGEGLGSVSVGSYPLCCFEEHTLGISFFDLSPVSRLPFGSLDSVVNGCPFFNGVLAT